MRQSSLIALPFVFLAGCSSEHPKPAAAPESVSGVALITAQRTSVPDYIEATGTVRAAQSAQLASQVMGTITRVNVHEGDAVRRGQVLITIDEAQPRAAYQSATAGLQASQQAIAAADADYALAESTMQRYQMLYDKKSVSPHEYDEVKASWQRPRRVAMPPTPTALRPKPGLPRPTPQSASPASALPSMVWLLRNWPMPAPWLRREFRCWWSKTPAASAWKPMSTRARSAPCGWGQAFRLCSTRWAGQTLTGKVVQIVPAADPASRTFTVKIDLPADPQIRSGLFGRARFPRGERESILVPQTALLHRGQLEAIYVVGKDEIAGLRYVTLGKPSGNEVEVLSGLDNGERIVAQPADRELAGKKVGAQ